MLPEINNSLPQSPLGNSTLINGLLSSPKVASSAINTPPRSGFNTGLSPLTARATLSPIAAKSLLNPLTPQSALNVSSPKSSGITLSSGFSFSFYKSPKSTKQPAVEPPHFSPPLRKPVSKKRNDTINKGVGHKIKKPKFKAKDMKKKLKATHIVHTLKQIKQTKRIAEHRVPSRNKTPLKKKFHKLSSPGISLLESPELGSDFMPDTKSSKFFTSRSRAAATVQINKAIKLSAVYGNITLHKTNNSKIPKKNIGHIVENELGALIERQRKSLEGNEDFSIPLPSVMNTETAAPTRVSIPSPSPKKLPTRMNSPRKLFTPSSQDLVNGSPLKNSSKTESPSKRNLPAQKSPSKLARTALSTSSAKTSMTLRSSPRKPESPLSKGVNSPKHKMPLKQAQVNYHSPLRNSPRLKSTGAMSPRKSPVKPYSPIKSLYMSPRNRRSPLRHPGLFNKENCFCCTPGKGCKFSPARKSLSQISYLSPTRSPRTSPQNSPTKKKEKNETKAIDQNNSSKNDDNELPDLDKMLNDMESKENNSKSANSLLNKSPRKSSRNQKEPENNNKSGFKYFPIFEPSKRLSDQKKDSFNLAKTRTSTRRSLISTDSSQTVIDAGQKKFGAERCKTCGVIYEIGDATDENFHMTFHNRLVNALKFGGWKNEKLALEPDFEGGRIIKISHNDPSSWWKKVEEVRDVIDTDLGFEENGIRVKDLTVVFLYIINRKIEGCLISEYIQNANRIVPNKETKGKVICCSEESTNVKVGVSRIWVAPDARRKGVATKLVDAMRRNVYPLDFLGMDDFAFSDPTESGLEFARRYTKKQDFLVYRH